MNPGYKERVKSGDLTPDQAMQLLLYKAESAGDKEHITSTRTWRWLWNRGAS